MMVSRATRVSQRKVTHPRRKQQRESLDAMLKKPFGTPVRLTKRQALAIVEAGIGARPDLPSGRDFVREIRGAWRGMSPRGRRSP